MTTKVAQYIVHENIKTIKKREKIFSINGLFLKENWNKPLFTIFEHVLRFYTCKILWSMVYSCQMYVSSLVTMKRLVSFYSLNAGQKETEYKISSCDWKHM